MSKQSSAIREIAIDKLGASPFQTRRFPRKNPELRGLAASITAVGVLQPILVRPVKRRFEIIAGERRVRASKLAKIKTIPAIVRELDDSTAAELCVVENLQREDLGVVEEGHAVAMLLERDDWTAETVAAEIGRTAQWVARRASIWTRLTDDWKKLAATDGHPANTWPAARLELVARLQPDQQAKLLKGKSRADNYFWSQTSGMLQRDVDGMLRVISSAPFSPRAKKDPMDPTADYVACVECPLRASHEPLLFDGIKPGAGIPKGDRCLDPVCWQSKTLTHFAAAVATCKKKHGRKPVLLVGYRGGVKLKGVKEANSWEFGPVKAKPFKGSTPVLIGEETDRAYGRIRHAKKTSRRQTTYRKTIEEKRRDLELKRLKDAGAAIAGAIRTAKRKPKPRQIVSLTLALELTSYHGPDNADTAAATLRSALGAAADFNALAVRLWSEQIIEDLAARGEHFWRLEEGTAAIELLTAVGELVGVDARPHVAAAIEANPEPEAWTKKKATNKKATKKKTTKKRSRKAAKK